MKNKNLKKYVIVSQRLHPTQINELSMVCVIIKQSKLNDLFSYIVNNGGRVISAIPATGMERNSIFNFMNSGYDFDYYFVISVCQKEIVDIFMLNLSKNFELKNKGNGKAFVIDILGFMGAKGPFVE